MESKLTELQNNVGESVPATQQQVPRLRAERRPSHHRGSVASTTSVHSDSTTGTSGLTNTSTFPKIATSHHVWALGVTAVIGCEFFGWQQLLAGGMGSALLASGVVGVAFLNLTYMWGELTSAVPYSGGVYGFARMTMPSTVSYMLATTETLDMIATSACYIISGTILLAEALADHFELPIGAETACQVGISLFIYVVTVSMQILPRKWFWNAMLLGSYIPIILLAIYVLGNVKNFDFHVNVLQPVNGQWFVGSANDMLGTWALAVWWFVGVEIAPMAAEDCIQPRHAVGYGGILSTVSLLILGLLTLVCASSLPPGVEEIKISVFPLSPGFQAIFPSAPSFMINLFSIIGALCPIISPIYGYSRQLFCLARAGYLPRWLTKRDAATGTPFNAAIAGSVCGYLMCLIVFLGGYVIKNEGEKTLRQTVMTFFADSNTILFNLMVLSATLTYVFTVLTYIRLQRRDLLMDTEFTYPFGNWGAWATLLAFAAIAITQLSCSTTKLPVFISLSLWYILAWLLYLFYGKQHLRLSPEDRMALSLDLTCKDILQSKHGWNSLAEVCKKEYKEEILECWKEANLLMSLKPAALLSASNVDRVRNFQQLYIAVNSAKQVNISSALRQRITVGLDSCCNNSKTGAEKDRPETLLHEHLSLLQAELETIIRADILPRFRGTKEYQYFIEHAPAELFRRASLAHSKKVGSRNTAVSEFSPSPGKNVEEGVSKQASRRESKEEGGKGTQGRTSDERKVSLASPKQAVVQATKRKSVLFQLLSGVKKIQVKKRVIVAAQIDNTIDMMSDT